MIILLLVLILLSKKSVMLLIIIVYRVVEVRRSEKIGTESTYQQEQMYSDFEK